jgi:toxin ParE1/3/4
MSQRLRFFQEAADEIEQIGRWYRDRNEAAESAFLREVDRAVESIMDAPERWPLHRSGTRRFVCPSFPYSLIYFVENDVINVVAVPHDRQRPGYWRKRLRR